ncbi:MAG TPA: phosphopantetheine-binding protein [Vicinamibacterales bacterium]|jgi:acyl carrier protein
MSNADVLHDRITKLLAEAMNLAVPSAETDLFDAGLLDSLTFVELLVHLEREFGVTTSVDDLRVDNFDSVAHIAAYVAARTGSTVHADSTAV